MNKIWLIIQREYLSRVKKKSFIIMTILGPLLIASVAIVPVWLSGVTDTAREVVVVDQTHSFKGTFKNTINLKFNYTFADAPLDTVQSIYKEASDVSILFIPRNIITSNSAILYSQEQPGLNILSYISNALSSEIEKAKLEIEMVDPSVIDRIKTTVNIKNNVDNNISNIESKLVVGLIGAILIYLFVFIYSAQVMRGVIEEKTSRIVEIIISSVRPFQLMMGKIVGVGLVGLTQFVLWIIITFGLFGVSQALFMESRISQEKITQIYKSSSPQLEKMNKMELSEKGKEIFENINNINWPLMLGVFVFYFLGGYLLYSSLFAAIGAAVDSEADTQQFMIPVTIPLVLSFMVFNLIVGNPNGPIAFWFSIIPLTSPIIMMVRISFGMEGQEWELILSMLLLVLGFIGTTWLAGKIYRTGILMYGKKVSYRELWKWLFYKG